MNKLFISLVIPSFLFANLFANNSNNQKLKPGFYLIFQTKHSTFQLNDTGKFFKPKSGPYISLKHIISTSVELTPLINSKRYPVISFVLDSTGIEVIRKLASKKTQDIPEMGLILNDKLRITGEFDSFSFRNFNGPGFNIQGTSKTKLEDFKNLKISIDSARILL